MLAFWVGKAGMCLTTAHAKIQMGSGRDRQTNAPHKQHNNTEAANWRF